MSSMESLQNPNPTKRSHNLVQEQPAKGQAATKQGQVATGDPDPVENSTKGLLYCLTPATDVGRGDTKRHRTARLWMLLAEGVAGKDIMRRFACKGNALHTLSRHRPILQGLGPVNPCTSMMRGQPVYTYMVSVPHANKHLIKFPVALYRILHLSLRCDSWYASYTINLVK